jgi:hypothetical protein
MAPGTVTASVANGHPPTGFHADPTRRTGTPTAADLARAVAAIDAALCRLPEDRLNREQEPYQHERARLLALLARTPAPDLGGVSAKLRLALADLGEGGHDEAGRLIASAVRDLDRLTAPGGD